MPWKPPVPTITESVASAGSQGSNSSTPTQNTFPRKRLSNVRKGSTLSQAPTSAVEIAQTRVTMNGAPSSKAPKAWGAKNSGSLLFKGIIRNKASMLAPSDVVSQFANLAIGPDTAVANPSEGPTGRGMERVAASTLNSTTSQLATVYAKPARWRPWELRKGWIVALPFHNSNTNLHPDPTDERLVQTVEGYVYSKRRMMVVMWIHERDMFCLPLYSWNGTGISGKPDNMRQEYVAVRNHGDKTFVNQGTYSPISVTMKYEPLTPSTAIHITGGRVIGCNEDITYCGTTTDDGYKQLLKLYNDLSKKAQMTIR